VPPGLSIISKSQESPDSPQTRTRFASKR